MKRKNNSHGCLLAVNRFKDGWMKPFLWPAVVVMLLIWSVQAPAQSTATRITDSFSRAAVVGNNHVGGLVGRIDGDVGIQRTYSAGIVNGHTQHIGGLVGLQSAEAGVVNSYWDVDVSGLELSAAGQGLTTEQMVQSSSRYVGWDFEHIWSWDSERRNNGYPYIRQVPPTTYLLKLLSNNQQAGTLAGGGNYGQGTLVAISALPTGGYAFISWTDAAQVLLSHEKILNYTMPATHTTLTANFTLATAMPEIADEHLMLYPNPFRDVLHVRHHRQYTRVDIFNLFGQCMLSLHLLESDTTIPTGHLPPGIYLINLTGEDGNQLVKRMIRL